MGYNLDDVKERNDIVEVARDLGMEVIQGKRAKCFHPENHRHGDRNPSISFDTRKNTFNCWVCPDIWRKWGTAPIYFHGLPIR